MRGMRIDGSGTGAWHRDREQSTFGSRTWREHHGASSGAQRARHDSAARDRARHELRDMEQALEDEAFARWDADVVRLAEEHAEETSRPAPRWNRRALDALTVRVVPVVPLPEVSVATLLSHGFRWSDRRGGMFWAPRTPSACAVAQSVCEPPVMHVTE